MTEKSNWSASAGMQSEQKRSSQRAGNTSHPVGVDNAVPRLEALDAPRWIASTNIVLGHFYFHELCPWSWWFSCWTQFFFLLSGFVLSYIEMARPADKVVQMTTAQYVRNRLITIYPTYMFSLVLYFFQENANANVFTAPLCFWLMQAWAPWVYKSWLGTWRLAAVDWFGHAWFLSVLVVYWVALRPIVRIFQRMSLAGCIATCTACWLFSGCGYALAVYYAKLVEESGGVLDKGPLAVIIKGLWRHIWTGYVHVFLAGIALARIFMITSMRDADTGAALNAGTRRFALHKAGAPFCFRYGCCLGYSSFFMLMLTWPIADCSSRLSCRDPFHWVMHNGGPLPLMALILFGGAIGVDPLAYYLFQSRPFMILGRISYAQYLLQFIVASRVHDFLARAVEDGWIKDLSPARYFITPPALITAAYLTERFVTAPYREWLRMSQP